MLAHGRGADERDLAPLAQALDPEHRLLWACPRAPLAPGFGFHWYDIHRLGEPEPETFRAARGSLATWLDGLLEERGLSHRALVLGGFSQGAVMACALALAPGRPLPTGLLALSGFVPAAPDFAPDFSRVEHLPVFIQHGAADPIIGVEWGRDAHRRFREAGADIRYHEFAGGHTVDPDGALQARRWLANLL